MRKKRGWHHTEKTKKKISLSRKGKKLTAEHRKKLSDSHLGCVPWNKGKKSSRETIEKLRKSHLGQVAWNKGLTKDTDLRVKKNTDCTNKTIRDQYRNGKISPLKGIKKSKSPWNKGKTREDDPRIPQPWLNRKRDRKTNQKISDATRRMWQDPEYVKKQMVARHVFPNKAELELDAILQELFSGDYKYVGDGEFILAGKCPDFVNVNGQKKIIELFGEPWHEKSEAPQRSKLFKSYGYETLIIWSRELRNKTKLKKRLINFNMKVPRA